MRPIHKVGPKQQFASLTGQKLHQNSKRIETVTALYSVSNLQSDIQNNDDNNYYYYNDNINNNK